MSEYQGGSIEAVEATDCGHSDGPHHVTLKDRLDSYGHLKSCQLGIAEYLGTLGDRPAAKLSARLSDCGNFLTFRDYYTVGEVRLTRACFCKKHTLCQLCAVRRAAKFLEKTLPKFEHILSQDVPRLYCHLIVLTVKNGPDCSERIRHIQSAWKKLLRRRSVRSKYPNTMLRSVLGGIVSLEVTNIGNGWHPHLNVMCVSTQPTFHWGAWKQEWFDITGDSRVVYFSQDTKNLLGTLAETVKYVTKFSDLAPAELWTLHKALKGHRTLRGFGLMHGLTIPDKLTDDVLASDLPYIEYVCGYLGAQGYSIMRTLRSTDLVGTEKGASASVSRFPPGWNRVPRSPQ